MQAPIPPPRVEELLAPLLASLPGASISPAPPTALLPLLSPILRQRVQLLSASSQDPWLSLLSWDSAHASKLEQAVQNERLEPHPVSGEVEVDWEYDVDVRYKRIDQETLQAVVTLRELGLDVKLVWCVGDDLGGGDGWRIGEVSGSESTSSSWGASSISAAEESFRTTTQPTINTHQSTDRDTIFTPVDDEDDDGDYWAQYDNTPARTPAPKNPDPPQAPTNGVNGPADELSYYEQYASVQPAMDSHDPDEAQQNGDVETSLGGDETTSEWRQHLISHPEPDHLAYAEDLAHPASSIGSSGSDTVARLERTAARHEQNEVGIKQHISTTMKSLYRLSKVGGIEREEFERLVKTELECLTLMDEDD
ncbi:hypothetical protein LCER1_G002112 [Lachnellula cervina]|uniref:Uncharacterized protein n=1 Tax=Lachnellula cervina TaxID=1316786 RepID=A0A7D8Z0S4_9HELO|nr:hypothetical protein LCER1_G002112 [Lachnellula cervina]